MKIAIIGLGGVGGYVGYHLLSAFKENRDVRIDFVARGTHGAAIREHGLALSSNGVTLDLVMPDRVLPKLPPDTYDLILICV
ncbi:MAG TPA: 2-dehydropantoate 2-reductase N-terminal domain-containing protein, partial [Chryseolinea sp.]